MYIRTSIIDDKCICIHAYKYVLVYICIQVGDDMVGAADFWEDDDDDDEVDYQDQNLNINTVQ